MPYEIKQWNQIADDYRQETILLGNGASIAVSNQFTYPSLLRRAQELGLLTNDIVLLFDFFQTNDFELILRLVWQAENVNRSLQIEDRETERAYISVRECLIGAVHNVHPQYEEVSSHLPHLYRFLKTYNTVLSLNYDLLVYWTMAYGFDAEDGHLFKDCFINGSFDDDWSRFRIPYRESSNTLVFYPHGSLALSRDRFEHEVKISSSGEGLLDAILRCWRSGNHIPLFVSEGLPEQKVKAIKNSYYLSTIYREVLQERRTSLTIYGWGFGDQDRHILKQMRSSGIERVAVSVYQGDVDFCIRAEQVIRSDLGHGVAIDFFDSASPGCWTNA